MKSPYTNLPPERFWRSGVSESHPLTVENLYLRKFAIGASDKIATAGSCFAQHVSNHLQENGFTVMDVEPPPPALSQEAAKSFGYNIYSARYGNIYTVRQLLQLARDAQSGAVDAAEIWEKDGRYYDAIRPNIEPQGFDSVEEALLLRRQHLANVKDLFAQMDVFIFTLGLSEAWVDKRSGRVYPTAPGTIAGDYDAEIHEFHNFDFNEIYDDFIEFFRLVRGSNPNFRTILTVSPVALTATASDDHVLLATTYSKSLLRSVAGALSKKYNRIDYFPSYELIASPWSRGFFYESNMRSVSPAGVAAVMRIFFDQHAPQPKDKEEAPALSREERRAAKREARRDKRRGSEEGVVCEDLLLETFAP
jgi:hypothetical protein